MCKTISVLCVCVCAGKTRILYNLYLHIYTSAAKHYTRKPITGAAVFIFDDEQEKTAAARPLMCNAGLITGLRAFIYIRLSVRTLSTYVRKGRMSAMTAQVGTWDYSAMIAHQCFSRSRAQDFRTSLIRACTCVRYGCVERYDFRTRRAT